jgi:hypothetical protein
MYGGLVCSAYINVAYTSKGRVRVKTLERPKLNEKLGKDASMKV